MKPPSMMLLVLLIIGCQAALPPPFDPPPPPVDPPATWGTTGDLRTYPVGLRWWEGFGDARLDAIIREALRQNPSLMEMAARLDAAAARARLLGAERFPSLTAGALASREESFFVSGVPGLPETLRQDRIGVSLDLGWEADIWGRIRSGQEAALAEVQGAEALWHGVVLSLSGQTAKSWFAALEAEEQIEVARSNLESAESLAETIEDRFARGVRSALDVRLARSEVAAVRANLARWLRNRDAALRQLEILAGRYPAARIEAGGGLPDLPGPVPPGLPAEILSRRPDLAAAERRIAAATARVSEARAGFYPRIALTARGGLMSDEAKDLFRGDFHVWSLVGNLTAPIFTGGRLKAEVARNEAQRNVAIAAFANAVLQAFGEVETTLASEGYLARQAEAIAGLVEEAEASLSLSGDRYANGLESILTVLEARRRFFAARSELLSLRLARLFTRVDIHLALGGGFQVETPTRERQEESR